MDSLSLPSLSLSCALSLSGPWLTECFAVVAAAAAAVVAATAVVAAAAAAAAVVDVLYSFGGKHKVKMQGKKQGQGASCSSSGHKSAAAYSFIASYERGRLESGSVHLDVRVDIVLELISS